MTSALYYYLAATSLLQVIFAQIPFGTETEGCTFIADEDDCSIKAHCTYYVETENDEYYNANTELGERCNGYRIYDNNYGTNRLPVHLIFKDENKDSTVPNDRNEYWILNVVTQLDLCENGYQTLPSLYEMPRLKSINFSGNYLTAAILNLKNLPKLEEIDFSNNAISVIETYSAHDSYIKLKIINLSNNYLVDIPDSVFESIKELESLDLSHNYIDVIGMSTFEGIKKLLHLNMGYNRLTSLNSALFRLGNLQELNLCHNRLEVLKFNDFEKLNKLTKLDLNNNNLKIIEPNVFSNMLFLTSLDLSDNQLTEMDKDTFANTGSLKAIDLTRNHLETLAEDLFKGNNVLNFSINENKLKGSLEKGMFEGVKTTSLDLANQYLESIDDYAFFGTDALRVLLLNSNLINVISPGAFTTLRFLEELNLSNNKIISIDFDKRDLISLRFLSLNANKITEINHENFVDLTSLYLLDLSSNKISQLESESFKSLRELSNFEIDNNPLSGSLNENTFDGLNSLPTLDISCTLLTNVHNYSFRGMAELKTLNISRSRINEIQFNSFAKTGAIMVLDLSNNILTEFLVNSTELSYLEVLLIDNNRLQHILPDSFHGLSSLLNVSLTYNNIQTLAPDLFTNIRGLKYLDVSFNPQLQFDVSCLKLLSNLNTLLISEIKNNVSFASINDSSLAYLKISNTALTNVTLLHVKNLKDLTVLFLNDNNIVKLENGSFNGLQSLTELDLSYNKLNYIQPGVFKDNIILYSLNVSHNLLKTINYGIFRGLIQLSIIDISFNEITDLQSEKFYEVKSLSELIADHNKIESVSAEEFHGTSLKKLSIGDNPIPCKVLVNLHQKTLSFNITAIRFDENINENFNGVTCNIDHQNFYPSSKSNKNVAEHDHDDILPVLVQIRDLLHSHRKPNDHSLIENKTDIHNQNNMFIEELTKIHETLSKTNNDSNEFTKTYTTNTKGTNVLLQKILTALSSTNSKAMPSPTDIVNKNNFTDIVQYVNNIKTYLENMIATEKQNIMHSLEKASVKSQTDSVRLTVVTVSPLSAKNVNVSDTGSSIFTETCVTLILLILIGFILYKFYKSRMFVRPSRTLSTRRIAEAVDNSNL